MTGLRGKPLRGQQEEVYAQAAGTERSDMHVLLPGEIVDFDAATQTATVKILHKPKVRGEDYPFPELKKVPVKFPRGGGGALTWPIGKGDPVGVQIASRNIDNWYANGGEQAADNFRMHDLSDAVAVPGGMVAGPQAVGNFNAARTELRMLAGLPKVEMGDDLLLIKFNDGCFIEMTAAGIRIIAPRIDLNE